MKKETWIKILKLALLVVSAIAAVKTIFLSCDIDEAYEVTMAYRLAAGDRLLIDMWEPHQTSALFPAVFTKLFLMFTGSVDYLLIYLRVIGTVMHIAVTAFLYKIFKQECGRNVSFFIAMVFMNFMPKWIQLPEFGILQCWFVVLASLCLMGYYQEKKEQAEGLKSKRYVFLGGLAMAGAVLAYPTAVILYPVYCILLFFMTKSKGGTKKEAVIDVGVFTLACFLSAVLFFLYLFSSMGIQEFLHTLPKLAMDGGHNSFNFYKWDAFGKELVIIMGYVVKYTAFTLVGTIALEAFLFFVRKRKPVLEEAAAVFLICFMLILSSRHVLGVLRGGNNQFYMQFRLMLMYLFGIYFFIKTGKESKNLFVLAWIPSFFGYFSVIMISDMNLQVSATFLILGILSTFVMMLRYAEIKFGNEWILKSVTYLTAAGFLCSMLVCKLYLVRVTTTKPTNIFFEKQLITRGPAKGVYYQTEEAEIYESNYDAFQEYVKPEDKVFFMSWDTMTYLFTNAQVASASVLSTPIFHDMYIDYFDFNKDKLPTVVVIDKVFKANENAYAGANVVMERWIEQYYDLENAVETENLIFAWPK